MNNKFKLLCAAVAVCSSFSFSNNAYARLAQASGSSIANAVAIGEGGECGGSAVSNLVLHSGSFSDYRTNALRSAGINTSASFRNSTIPGVTCDINVSCKKEDGTFMTQCDCKVKLAKMCASNPGKTICSEEEIPSVFPGNEPQRQYTTCSKKKERLQLTPVTGIRFE